MEDLYDGLCADDFTYPGMEVDAARDQLEELGYFDYLYEEWEACPSCNGTGQISSGIELQSPLKRLCPSCKGAKGFWNVGRFA